jgi:dihydrodipicolinate synthase/N-acetylneuraminate lyase
MAALLMAGRWPRTMPALITPFDDHGEIDVVAHLHNISVATAVGARGVLIAGSTGEGPYLEPGERTTLVAAARESDTDITVMCGISAESDRQALRQIDDAADGGANAALVATPGTLVRNRTQPIIDFYVRVAEASALPVFLYTVPRVTAYELPIEAILELAPHANIVGMKDSGGNAERLDQLAGVLSADFVVYAGSSRALADSADRGAHGAITASANYAWKLADAAISGDRSAQSDLTELVSVIELHGVPGTKYAASLTGMRPAQARLPLQPLSSDAQDAIRAILA